MRTVQGTLMEWILWVLAFDSFRPELTPPKVMYGPYSTYEAWKYAAKRYLLNVNRRGLRQDAARCLLKDWMEQPDLKPGPVGRP